MPNWAFGYVNVTGTRDGIKSFIERFVSEDDPSTIPGIFTPYCKKSIPKSQYYFSRISLRNGTANRLMCAPTNSRYIQKYNHIITTTIVERLPYTPKSLTCSMYAEKPQENRFQLIAVNNAPGNCFVSFSFTFGT